jgi:hypothetical protein
MRAMIRSLALLAVLGAASGTANANFHLWLIKQLYSNADGTVQYIQLQAYASQQQFLSNHTITVTQGSTTHSFTLRTDLPGDTATTSMDDYGYGYYMPMATYKSMVIATQGFANMGLLTPDYIVPNGFLFTAGTAIVNWGEGSDTFPYSSLPTDGSHALNRNGGIVDAIATNFMGESAAIRAITARVPAALSGLFFNPNESGWGVNFTQRGSNVFAAWYTYDTNGNPKWYVSTCAMNGGATGTTGTCSGALYEVSGPTFFGTAFDPARANAVQAGNLQVTFTDTNNASMTYTGVAGQTRTVQITRQPLAAGAVPGVNYTDLWWNSNESGWGMAITQQASTIFLAWYVYDANARPTWYVATCSVSGSSCSGSLLQTVGPHFGPTFDSSQVHSSQAGSISVNFTDPNNAMITYTVNGLSASKNVTRQIF